METWELHGCHGTETDFFFFFYQRWRAGIMVYFVVGEEWRLQQVELDNNVTWHTDDVYFTSVQIKNFNTKSVVIKEWSFYYCLNWLTFCEFGIVSVSVTGSEMTDSELSLLAVVSRCWSMDSLIGSVCTWNVKWETHLEGEASIYLLSVVCCSQKLCWTRFAGWFSWLFPAWLQWNDLFRCCNQLR